MRRETVDAVHARAGYGCEICGTTNAARWSLHHRRPRGMGGSKRADTNMPSNILLLCGSGTEGCHGYVESHRAESLNLGRLLLQGQSPAVVPVDLVYGLVVLDDDGGWQTC